MAVEQSMKLIALMRTNGWITNATDNEIWSAVSEDLTFSNTMRKHSGDSTRLLSVEIRKPSVILTKNSKKSNGFKHIEPSAPPPSPIVISPRSAYIKQKIPDSWNDPVATMRGIATTDARRELAKLEQGNRWDVSQKLSIDPDKLILDHRDGWRPFKSFTR